MARRAREKCESGVYHIVLRGINRQDIFYDEEDFQHFLETIEVKKESSQFALYGYCLMNNHVHLLVREQCDPTSRIMSRIGTSYAWWYNLKYERTGHVFQGRYGSEGIGDDAYVLAAIRYIHNNPVKAEIVSKAEEYRWSSIHAYYGDREYPNGLTDTELILGMIHQDREKAQKAFIEFMKRENNDIFLDDTPTNRKSDEEVKTEIETLLKGQSIGKLAGLPKEEMRGIIRKMKECEGVTQRQIARVTGISPNIVFKA
ncbi:MAG: transposase [Syntrophomonas sp.]